jgi:23S rRNA pseudouridine1911/1915/1917 synthase
MVLQGSHASRRWTIGSDSTDVRLDAFLRARLPFLSRRQLAYVLREQCFSVNGRRARKGDRLVAGDVLQFDGPAAWLSAAPIPNPRLAVPVIYEDTDLLVLDKPAGMNCHGFSGRSHDTLVNFLLAHCPTLSSIGKNLWEPGLVHRLDRETSGLLLVAKTQGGFDDLRYQFRRRVVEKKYLALAWGSTADQGTIAIPLAHDSKDARKMRAIFSDRAGTADKKIWQSLTLYRKIGEQQGVSLLELEMKTGVTHQLRAHLAAIAHPIVGDRLYGAEDQETFGLRRHFLHASKLGFTHPRLKDWLKLEAPLPVELANVLERLKLNIASALIPR